jgi:carbon monoxide dehydrogenase subunit G
MAEVEYTTTAKLPIGVIWDFVQEMDHWAPWVAGYQSHEKQSATESVWILKGDVGVLARTVKFQVTVTEWAGPERVSFALKGLNEPMQGSGAFVMEPVGASGPAPVARVREGFGARLLAAVARFFFRLRHGRAERAPALAGAGGGSAETRLTFRLRVDPGGPMAPMVNALMRPLLVPASEDLANRILAHLEAQATRHLEAQSARR